MPVKKSSIGFGRFSLSALVIFVVSISCVEEDTQKESQESRDNPASSPNGDETIEQGRDETINSDEPFQASDAATREIVTDSAPQSGGEGTPLNTNDSGTGVQDAQIDDSSTDTLEQTDAGAIEQCLFNYRVMETITLFTAYGICQSPTETCVGGTPAAFDLSGLFAGESSNLVPAPPEPSANCPNGLICCVLTDQCESVEQQIMSSGLLTALYPGIAISCATAGACTGSNVKELALGCPPGEGCCVQLPSLAVDSGAPNSADAGI